MRRVTRWLAVVVALAGSGPSALDADSAEEWMRRRDGMVRDQIEARGVSDPAVIAAMRSVPRERFVPTDSRHLADADGPLPIGFKQTISQPYIVAFMTELLDLRPGHRVLEIGTGSGYQTAVLAALTDDVHSLEIVPELAVRARETLGELGYESVTVRHGNGYLGWPGRAPFDRIILTAAPPQVPEALLDQLAPRGRLVAPVGRTSEAQELILVTKDAQGNVRRERRMGVRFVPMVGEPGER